MPIAFLLLFVFVFGGAIETGNGVVRRLPAARHPAHHRSRPASPTPLPALPRPAERHLRAVPVHADRPVRRALGARADLAGRQPDVGRRWSCWRALVMGFRSGAGRAGVARRWPASSLLFTLALTWLAVIPGPDREVGRRRERVLLPADPPAVHQLGLRADRPPCRPGAGLRREPAGDLDRRRDPQPVRRAAGRQRHLGRAGLVRRPPRRRLRLRDGAPTAAGSPDGAGGSGRLGTC